MALVFLAFVFTQTCTAAWVGNQSICPKADQHCRNVTKNINASCAFWHLPSFCLNTTIPCQCEHVVPTGECPNGDAHCKDLTLNASSFCKFTHSPMVCEGTSAPCSCPCRASHCEHGGVPNVGCTSCVNCTIGWIGPHCNVSNSTSADVLLRLQEIIKEAEQALNKTYGQGASCRATGDAECPGFGFDIVTGEPGKLPVIELTPNPNQPFNGHNLPYELNITVNQDPTAILNADTTTVFPLMSNFAKSIQQSRAAGRAYRGVFTQDKATIFQNFYQEAEADRALTVTQAKIVLYTSKIPIYNSELSYRPTRYFTAALEEMAKIPYSTDQTAQLIYKTIRENFGTHMITTSEHGGLVEQRTRWNTPLLQTTETVDSLLSYAKADLYHTTSLFGAQPPPPAAYQKARELDGLGASPWTIFGGDPLKLSNLAEWQASLKVEPAMITYSGVPLSGLPVMAKQGRPADYAEAVKNYVQEAEAAWGKQALCPKSCHGNGKCASGAEACLCQCSIGRKCMSAGCMGQCCAGSSPCNCDYHLVKDSWSDQWSDEGYIKLNRGNTSGSTTGDGNSVGSGVTGSGSGGAGNAGVNKWTVWSHADAAMWGLHMDCTAQFPRNIVSVIPTTTDNCEGHQVSGSTLSFSMGCGGDCDAACDFDVTVAPPTDASSSCMYPNKCA